MYAVTRSTVGGPGTNRILILLCGATDISKNDDFHLLKQSTEAGMSFTVTSWVQVSEHQG